MNWLNGKTVLQMHVVYVYVYLSPMKNGSFDKGSETRESFLSDQTNQ